MSHTAQIPREGPATVRSSAEAAVPPPVRADRAAAVSRFERAVTEALALISAGEPSLSAGFRFGGLELDPPGSFDRSESIVLLRAALAALHDPDVRDFDPSRAGIGSIVHAFDLATSESTTYEIVPLDLVDVSLARVTAASPIGQALAGAREGDLVEIDTPGGRRKLRVDRIRTLLDRLGKYGNPST
jgi:hypothetical protein